MPGGQGMGPRAQQPDTPMRGQGSGFIVSSDGVILTKLDGTAKGGVVISICEQLKVPVRFVGVGEGIDDLQPFDAKLFAEALLASDAD